MAGWRSRDYFAEMYVAGVLADAGWNVYFPHRDQGFDLIATLATETGTIMRPVQVKGKYPTEGKLDKARYGYVGELTAFHDDRYWPFRCSDVSKIVRPATLPGCRALRSAQ